GVEGREHEVPRLGRHERRAQRGAVAQLAHQDHVGVLAQGGAQRAREAGEVGVELALPHQRAAADVEVLDRVLERDHVDRAGGVAAGRVGAGGRGRARGRGGVGGGRVQGRGGGGAGGGAGGVAGVVGGGGGGGGRRGGAPAARVPPPVAVGGCQHLEERAVL